MLARFRIQHFADKLEALTILSGQVGMVTGAIYAPLELLQKHSFSEGTPGVFEALVVIPLTTGVGGALGWMVGGCFGFTLPITAPLMTYHYGRQHYEQRTKKE